MNYIIHTPSVARLKKEILDRVSEKVDANGKGIATWQVEETEGSEKVLVYTNDQRMEKGCIALKQVLGSNELKSDFITGNLVRIGVTVMIRLCLGDSRSYF